MHTDRENQVNCRSIITNPLPSLLGGWANIILNKERVKWRFLRSKQCEALVALRCVHKKATAKAASLDMRHIPFQPSPCRSLFF